jgi:hypothetical protein
VQDTKILRAVIESRDAFERVSKHVNEKELTPTVQFWWRLVDEYYGRDSSCSSVDVDTLRAIGERRITNPKHAEATLGVLSNLPAGVSSSNVVAAVLELKRYNVSAEFASAAMAGDMKKANKLLRIVNELYETTTLEKEERRYALPVEELYGAVGRERRIPLLPKLLNDRIGGGVLPGHHVLVFGRTEVGKSAFVINMASGLVRKGQRVLYVGNEDEINNVKARFVARLTRRSPQECEQDLGGTAIAFRERGGEERLRLVHLQPGTVSSLRKDIEEWKPTVVVVDQIRNLDGPEDGMTQRMEGNAIRFRSLLNEYGLVGISVTQAGNRDERHNSDGPIWLGAGDVDSSRVGLPAQVDLMLGIGANSDLLSRGQRAVSLCKNKLHSSPLSREGFIVQLDLARCIIS